MYFCLVGSKVVTAMLVGKSRQFLKSRNYKLIIKLLGIGLIAFAYVYFKDGLEMIGVF